MLHKLHQEWLSKSSELTEKQLKASIAKLQAVVTGKFENPQPEPEITSVLSDTVVDNCPRCQHPKFIKWGSQSGRPRWKCNGCNKTFNVLTNTPLARLRNQSMWLTYAQCMIDGLSIRRCAAACNIAVTTAFRFRHRFAESLASSQSSEMKGIAECDVTLFYDNRKGDRAFDGVPRKRGGDGIPKGAGPHLISVITLQDRNGNGAERVAREEVTLHATDLFKVHLEADTLLLTDGDKCLCKAVKDIREAAKSVSKAANERNPLAHKALKGLNSRGSKESPYHIQTINSYHSHLKRWIIRFHGVATKYLHNYVGWHRHKKANHFKDNPNLFIRLIINPLSIDPLLVKT